MLPFLFTFQNREIILLDPVLSFWSFIYDGVTDITTSYVSLLVMSPEHFSKWTE
jgi:hypothetical protein